MNSFSRKDKQNKNEGDGGDLFWGKKGMFDLIVPFLRLKVWTESRKIGLR